tara:strand:+ start:572 stop:1177 length:606 start_codon:yes stop_codon:yes gene_type:complete
MKNELLELLASNQGILKTMLKDCPPIKNTPPEDVLQDFYLFVYTKPYKLLSVEAMFPEGKLKWGLVYMILKNFVLGEIRKEERKKAKRDIAYESWRENQLDSGAERDENIAIESNLLILEEIKKDLTDEEYQGMLDIIDLRLIYKFKDEQGEADMVAYQAARYKLNRKYLEIKEKATLFKYLTAGEVDAFETYTTLTLNLK